MSDKQDNLTHKITYRTTEENAKVIEEIAQANDWTPSKVTHKIVTDFVKDTRTVTKPDKQD